MNKTLLPLTIAALVGALTAGSLHASHPDDLVDPSQFYSEFGRRAGIAEDRLRSYEEAAAELVSRSRSCSSAQGSGSACEGLDALVTQAERARAMYGEAAADVSAWQDHLKGSVAEATAEGCANVWFAWRRRNCESNLEAQQGWVADATQRAQALDNRAQGVQSSVQRAITEAQRHRSAAASAAERAEKAERAAFESKVRGLSVADLGAYIARCRRDRDADGCGSDELGFIEQVYTEQSDIALSPEQLPPVTSFEEACQAWATPDPGSTIYGSEICDPEVREGMDPTEAREAIVEFLLRGHGGRLGCNRATTRCLPTNYDTDGEADRMVGDMVVTGPAYTAATELADAPSALDSVLARDPDGVIDCQGGAGGLFGLAGGGAEAGQGVECGQAGALPAPAVEPPAAEFIPTDHIYGQSVLGQGAEVRRGDTLGEIAVAVRRQAGRPRADLYAEPGGVVDLIAYANGIDNPHLIHPQDGIRVPTGECMAEAIDAPNDEARQVLGACELLVRVSGDVPANLSVATQMARERLRRQEGIHGQFSDEARQEFLMDALNTAASPAGEFAGLSSVPAETFIEAQTGRFGIDYRPLITEVTEEAARRDYNDEERFRLLYRRLRQANAATD